MAKDVIVAAAYRIGDAIFSVQKPGRHYSIRNAIETWMNHINSHADNKTSANFADTDWRSTAELTQYGKDGSPLQTYTFFDIWPMTLAEIALSYDTASDLEQFDVTWAYNYYQMSGQGGAASLDEIQD